MRNRDGECKTGFAVEEVHTFSIQHSALPIVPLLSNVFLMQRVYSGQGKCN